MAKITPYAGYAGPDAPGPPKPVVPPDPMIVTVQDGVPVAYPGCHCVGVRVVHPVNARAPARNLGSPAGANRPNEPRTGAQRAGRSRQRANAHSQGGWKEEQFRSEPDGTACAMPRLYSQPRSRHVRARTFLLASLVVLTVAAAGCGRYSYRSRRDVDAGHYDVAMSRSLPLDVTMMTGMARVSGSLLSRRRTS